MFEVVRMRHAHCLGMSIINMAFQLGSQGGSVGERFGQCKQACVYFTLHGLMSDNVQQGGQPSGLLKV